MKSVKTDDMEINISVIGLSGSEKIKGVRGVGKSCLCNRLTQPDYYKTKHSSVVSSINFYGSEMNNNQWIYWGCVEREIRNKRYRFRLLEQTVMVDDVSHSALNKKEDYAERATAVELRGSKQIHSVGPVKSGACIGPRTSVHMFILVYDVSEVDRRDPAVQDSLFRQLFDRAIASKLPVIVVATKHDNSSPNLVDRLTTVLNRRSYSKYALVETSANRGVNIDRIFEVAAIEASGSGGKRQRPVHLYRDGVATLEARLDQERKELKKVAVSVLDGDLWHACWSELRILPTVAAWVDRLGSENVETTFDEVRIDMRLRRRVRIQQKHKECLVLLLGRFQSLLVCPSTNMSEVVDRLTNDSEFMSNFVPFNRDAEYFDFNAHGNLLPQYILDKNNDNNLIYVIKEHMEQRTLEDQLFNHLIIDCPGNFKKSLKEIGDDLRQHMRHFILEKIVVNVYGRFQQHCLKLLECQFLEAIHERPNLFLSQGILKHIDLGAETSSNINGLHKIKSSNEHKHDKTDFLLRMATEIYSKIKFSPPPISEEERQIRISWIYNYLTFLQSSNQSECIYGHVTETMCNTVLIGNVLSDTRLSVETDVTNLPHLLYVIVIGDDLIQGKIKELIIRCQSKVTLELCKIHCAKYNVTFLDNIDMLFNVINELNGRVDKCCSVCVLISSNSIHSQPAKQIFFLERSSNYKMIKYLVHKIVDELLTISMFDDESLDYPNQSVVHISTLISSCRRLMAPSVIWIVTVCGDQYNYDHLLTFLIDIIKLHSIPRRLNGTPTTLSGCFTSKEIDRHYYRLCFKSYHEAIKSLIRSATPPQIDGMLLVCSLKRLASLKTCLAIKKYLPSEIKSLCHLMLLGVNVEGTDLQAQVKAEKHGLKYASIDLNTYKDNMSDLGRETAMQILNFIIGVFNGSSITESMDDLSTNASSLSLQIENNNDGQRKSSNQMCKVCGQCKSHENVNTFLISDSSHEVINELLSYDEVLGDNDYELFEPYSTESVFQEPVDACNEYTEVKCSQFKALGGSSINHSQPFRARMRSQSGPDLSNSFGSNKSSLNMSGSSVTYCPGCGAKTFYSTDCNDSRKGLLHKTSSDKESQPKKLLAQLLGPLRRHNEPQGQESRKNFVRSTSKRHK